MKEASTVSTVDIAGLRWRKSSRSTANGSNGNCVEVAFAGSVIAVRDSKNPEDTFAMPVAAFAALLRSV
jgi:Domain of unknown function (DUF397)